MVNGAGDLNPSAVVVVVVAAANVLLVTLIPKSFTEVLLPLV